MPAMKRKLLGCVAAIVLAMVGIVVAGTAGSNRPRPHFPPTAVVHPGRDAQRFKILYGSASAPTVGETFTTTQGTWTNTPTSWAYAWDDCNSSGASCSAIGGATSSTYTIVTGDVGHTIASFVTATNASG